MQLFPSFCDHAQLQDGWTPLCLAARWGRLGSLRLLVEAHADPDLQTNDGRTAGELLSVSLPKQQATEAMQLLSYRPQSARSPDAAETEIRAATSTSTSRDTGQAAT